MRCIKLESVWQLLRVLADAQAAVSAPAVELDALQFARVMAAAQAGAAASAVDVDVGDAAHSGSVQPWASDRALGERAIEIHQCVLDELSIR